MDVKVNPDLYQEYNHHNIFDINVKELRTLVTMGKAHRESLRVISTAQL